MIIFIWLLITVAAIVWLTIKFQLHPFLGLLFGAFGMLIPFLIAAFLKTAQGSSTVAIITTSAIMVPLIAALGFDSSLGKALVLLAIGAGSITVSHVNDSYFWVIAKCSNMDTATALKTHTIASMLMGFTGLVIVQLLALSLL